MSLNVVTDYVDLCADGMRWEPRGAEQLMKTLEARISNFSCGKHQYMVLVYYPIHPGTPHRYRIVKRGSASSFLEVVNWEISSSGPG